MNKILLIIATILISAFCYSQNVKIAQPEFLGTIVNVNSNTGNGLALETIKLVIKTEASASLHVTGIGKATTKVSVEGSTSAVKVKKDSTIQIIYRASYNTVNPVNVIQLIRFTVKGGNRETELASVVTFIGTSSGDIGFVQFTAKKYKASS